MKFTVRNAIRLLVVMALLLTSVVAFAQDEVETSNTAIPFVGIRFMEANDGVLVTGIISNTPAQSIGLRAGDVITSVDNQTVNADNVQDVVWQFDANDTVTLRVDRNGRELSQAVTLMERPVDLFDNPLYVLPFEPSTIGLVVTDFDDHLFVLGTVTDSVAEDAGFLPNDSINSINTDKVDDVADAAIAMADMTDGEVATFYITRGDEEITITVVMDRRQKPRPRPRVIESTYETNTIKLGYGADFIEIQALSNGHELSQAGLVAGDVIVAVNGASIADMNNLFASDSIDLTVERDSGTAYFNVPSSVAPLLMFGLDAPLTQEAGEWLGLHEKQVTLGVRYIQLDANSEYFGNSGVTNGAYIAEVIDGLPAAQAGLQVGDIIVAIDGLDTTLQIDLRNRIYAHQPGDVVTLDVLRNGVVYQVKVTLRIATS